MPGDRRLGLWRLVVHTGSTDPGEYVPKKHTQTPPSPQSTVLPLPWYFKNYFPIFSAQEKPTTGTSSGPICVFSLNASFSFFLLGFILSVLGGLMSTWSVCCGISCHLPTLGKIQNSTAAEFLLKEVSFCLSPNMFS